MNDEKSLLPFDCEPFKVLKSRLNESAGGNNKTIVTGVLQRADTRNQNGRIYPYEILQREAKKYDERFVKQNRALGELDHPESSVVNLKNVSHNIMKMWWEGKDLMGDVEILSTPNGNILKELLICGITVGISSRGLGNVKKITEGTLEVKEDFDLLAFDFVSDPSTQGAFMRVKAGSLNESVSLVKDPVTNKWTAVESIVHEILSEVK